MTDEITHASPVRGGGAKQDLETLERSATPVNHRGQTLAASSMDPAHRALVEKSLKRKLDARCSLFVVIYILNYLDRNNIASARLKGLQSGETLFRLETIITHGILNFASISYELLEFALI
ncbi:hypothetical protein F4819DRAFT_211091 [Hypoxylon fuscum]|nr:hypothetical protein F4819DRAFT_211091 [Hypoxylon fuscum]